MYPDFKELLSALNAHEVRYLIVGGYAVSIHAQPRATKDLDILVDPSKENSDALLAALKAFEAPVGKLAAEDLVAAGSFFRMGRPPAMVDIMSRIKGVEFAQAWECRVVREVDNGLSVPFISRDDLMIAKLAAGRPEDLADVAALRAAASQGSA